MPETAEQVFTEAELTGEEPTPESTTTTDAPAPVTTTPTVPETKEAEAKPEEVVAAPSEEKPAKKDDRVVPYAAVHEERIARQKLAAENAELKKALAEREPVKDPAAMILEDPEGAIREMQARYDALRDEMDRRDMEYRIKAEVPDLLDRSVEIEEMLLGEGLSPDAIRGMIGGAGREVPALLKVFAKYSKTPKTDDIRSQVAAELTPQITAEVTKQLMAKFNIVEAGKDISRLPGAAPTGKLEINSEADFAKLTTEQQEKWLSGDL